MKVFTLFRTLSLLFLMSCHSFGQDQSDNRFGLSAYYEFGFQGKTIHLNQEKVQDYISNGLNIRFNYSYCFNQTWSLVTAIGYRYFSFQGNVISGQFNGFSHKLLLSEKLRYCFSPPFSVLVGLTVLNNLDFENFARKKMNLFRFNTELEFSYQFWRKLEMVIGYSVGFNPLEDVFLITNPLQSLHFGLHYFIK